MNTLEEAVVEAAISLTLLSNEFDFGVYDHGISWEVREDALLEATNALLSAREKRLE